MTTGFVSRGFVGKRRRPGPAERVPPGQYVTDDYPVLSAGPTPFVPLDQWQFTIEQLGKELIAWTWAEFLALPTQQFVADIHCVTKWTKLDTHWQGVSVDCQDVMMRIAPMPDAIWLDMRGMAHLRLMRRTPPSS